MVVTIYYFNGNSRDIEQHYQQKEYRDDIVVRIDDTYYEVYFFTAGVLEYEMTKDGFFSSPGLIILEDIRNDTILLSIQKLIGLGYFARQQGYQENPINNGSVDKWYRSSKSNFTDDNLTTIEFNL